MGLTSLGQQLPGEVIDTFYVPVDDIFSDEPATYLREFNAPMANGRSQGRFQEIHVLRDSYVGTWLYCLGPSRRFTAQVFQVVGGSVRAHRHDIETVESIRYVADDLRNEGGLRREIDPDSLIVTQDHWLQSVESKQKTQRHESVSGRYFKAER